MVTSRVVNLLERTESDLITGSDHTLRPVHSCNTALNILAGAEDFICTGAKNMSHFKTCFLKL